MGVIWTVPSGPQATCHPRTPSLTNRLYTPEAEGLGLHKIFIVKCPRAEHGDFSRFGGIVYRFSGVWRDGKSIFRGPRSENTVFDRFEELVGTSGAGSGFQERGTG